MHGLIDIGANLARLVNQQAEDTIEEEVRSHERAESLHAERLDGPDLDNSLADRPIGEIISEIHHDLGLHAMAGMALWKRRTPADVVILCAQAGAPSMPPARTGVVRERPGDRMRRDPLAPWSDADIAGSGHPPYRAGT